MAMTETTLIPDLVMVLLVPAVIMVIKKSKTIKTNKTIRTIMMAAADTTV